MNWLQYRLLLEETRPHHYKYLIKRGPRKIDIEVLDKKTNKPVTSKSKPPGLAHLQLLKRGDNPHWEVSSSASPLNSKEVGLELYKMALELASLSGLSPDSIESSDDAVKVWNILGKEPSISREKKEEFKYEGDDKPFFFVYRKDGQETLNQNDISYEKVEEEPQEKEPEMDVSDEAMQDIWDELEEYREHVDKNDLRVEKPAVNEPTEELEEDYQEDVKKSYRKMKIRLITTGANKYKSAPFVKKPDLKRSKSAPAGFGGS